MVKPADKAPKQVIVPAAQTDSAAVDVRVRSRTSVKIVGVTVHESDSTHSTAGGWREGDVIRKALAGQPLVLQPGSPSAITPAAPAAAKNLEEARAKITVAAAEAEKSGNYNAYAQAVMELKELDPQSSLNVKLRAAKVTAAPEKFSKAFSIIADAADLPGVSPAKIKRAVQSSIDFAADHYVASRGAPSPFFNVMQLTRPGSDSTRDFLLNNDHLSLFGGSETLRVEVPHNRLTGTKDPLSATELHKQWNDGTQFDDEAVKRVWPLINPTGVFRTTVLRTVGDIAKKLGFDLGKVKDLFLNKAATARDELKKKVREEIESNVTSIDGKSTALVQAMKVIDESTDAELIRMIDNWSSMAQNPATEATALNAMVDVALVEVPNVSSKAYSLLVAVANSHEIDVKADTVLGQAVNRFVRKRASNGKVDVEAWGGLVAVATHDKIDVQASITAASQPAARLNKQLAFARAFGV